MAEKTFHVFSSSERWAVQKVGKKATTFSSQNKALKAAREIARSQREAQVVLHDGKRGFLIKDVHGLPVVQKPPQKSSLGTARISQAIWKTLQKRLKMA